MIDVEVLGEVYTSLKQYIPTKDRQEAADNLMSILVDSLSDEELQVFGAIDSKLSKALRAYVDEDEDDDYNNEDEE
jgi:uncharacterized protein with gpF-like domain